MMNVTVKAILEGALQKAKESNDIYRNRIADADANLLREQQMWTPQIEMNVKAIADLEEALSANGKQE